MDPERLARIPARMKSFVDQGTIAGAVTLAARHGVVASLEAVGYQDLENKRPMRTDSIFEIMSMTKPVTAAGTMLLMEEGRLALSDPVEKHLPEFRGLWVIDSPGEKERRLKRPSRAITIRDLPTHTSGMPELPPEGGKYSTASDLYAFYQMMANGGTYNKRRVFSRGSVELMTAVHTAELKQSWGLGWSVVRDPAGTLQLESAGTFGHGGAFGTYGWIDPRKDLIGVLLIQRWGGGDCRVGKSDRRGRLSYLPRTIGTNITGMTLRRRILPSAVLSTTIRSWPKIVPPTGATSLPPGLS